MKKSECFQKYGEARWGKRLQQRREWYRAHVEEEKEKVKKWQREHPEKERKYQQSSYINNLEEHKIRGQQASRKEGKFYERNRKNQMAGLPHEKRLVRGGHNRKWTPYKKIIAPKSQLHHEWIPGSVGFRGVALVEKNQHMHGFIDVIQILEGEITLLTEEEVRTGGIK